MDSEALTIICDGKCSFDIRSESNSMDFFADGSEVEVLEINTVQAVSIFEEKDRKERIVEGSVVCSDSTMLPHLCQQTLKQ